jgi:hypothetical protein
MGQISGMADKTNFKLPKQKEKLQARIQQKKKNISTYFFKQNCKNKIHV